MGSDTTLRWGADAPDDIAAARERLLDAAETRFEQYGIIKTTVEDIARTAHVSRATVYRYFATTEDLFTAAAEVALGGFVERGLFDKGDRAAVAKRWRELRREDLARRGDVVGVGDRTRHVGQELRAAPSIALSVLNARSLER